MKKRIYLCIDLKSFYASVECVERGLDPMRTNLVVADLSRTEKTICLAVTPSLKSYGISGRARLFEVIARVGEVNAQRKRSIKNREFCGKSYDNTEIIQNTELELDYIVAPPRMAFYIDYSTRIYNIYLKYAAPEDIHVYSIDEVFIDVTDYLPVYKMTAHDLAKTIINDILKTTGITAAAGIGTNLYLAKIAMDIMAKKIQPDEDGVCIAELDEISYRRELWDHEPLTDFWRVGSGYAKKLHNIGLYTIGDVAHYSLSKFGEDKLYKLFGINAELLIDHAWGWEPCTLEDIRRYRPENKSIGSGQVLHAPYDYEKAKLVVREMAELLSLDLVGKRVVTDQIVLTIGYDMENLKDSRIAADYRGEVTTDRYGRKTPKHAHGTINLDSFTSSTKTICEATVSLYERIVDPRLLVRRINISANHVKSESDIENVPKYSQLDLLTDYSTLEKERKEEEQRQKKEQALQETTISIREKFGKNAILKGMNLKEGATARDRNRQIGGHKA